jgi:hypothetical protein
MNNEQDLKRFFFEEKEKHQSLINALVTASFSTIHISIFGFITIENKKVFVCSRERERERERGSSERD